MSGFDFTPTVEITVTELGFFDYGRDGLFQSHPVGIFQTNLQTLVAPIATVTTSSPLASDSDFRYTPVTPFVLSAGVTYTLAEFDSGPQFDLVVTSAGSGGIVFGTGLNYERLRQTVQSQFGFPTVAGQQGAIQGLFIGPNFSYTVPAPCATALLGIGGLVAARRRR